VSAVSKNVTPDSRAASTTARVPSSVSVAVCARPKLLQPSPTADTARPDRPSRRSAGPPGAGTVGPVEPGVETGWSVGPWVVMRRPYDASSGLAGGVTADVRAATDANRRSSGPRPNAQRHAVAAASVTSTRTSSGPFVVCS
jgi:hypothetical protein